MFRLFACILSVLVLTVPETVAAQAAASSRETTRLLADWRFAQGEQEGAAAAAFDDSGWTRITLPHTFNAAETGDGTYYRGPAWYRRAFDITELRHGRRLFVQFDGAALVAAVYLNGKPVCRHQGGYAAFRCDLTGALVHGVNLMAVRVDNSLNRAVTPLGGDFTVFGGLYRPVSLIETDDVHFDLLDHGGPGLYARAHGITAYGATISTVAKIANDGPRAQTVSIHARILDAEGREVAQVSAKVLAPAGRGREAMFDMRLPSPRLWDGVRDPYLYRLVARIGEAGDEVSVPLGVRTVRIDPERGFLLNGKPYPLRGVNLMHSARPGEGTAVTDAEVAEDFAIMRDMGSTGARLAHFQHPQAAYDEADRLGLALWTEIGINGVVDDGPAFQANAEQQMRELIAQNYNHPSVVIWGLGNEVYSTEPIVEQVLRALQAVTKQMDQDRPTAYAHCCQQDDHPKALISDIIGFNRYFGWYPDQKGSIGDWAAGFHTSHPERSFGVSEYGAGASILHQEDPPGPVVPSSGWHPEQNQALYHERNWLALKDKPYLWGTFIWVGFDLASAGRHEGDRRGINDKGLVTYDRQVRKDAWYWYRAWWSDRPTLYITSRRFTQRPDPDVVVKIYTSAPQATLFLNGVEVGTQQATDRIIRWPVTLRTGANVIEVRAVVGGETLTDKVMWLYERPPGMLAHIPGAAD
ncbi:glycoside hydrolase family 2 protein [Sphingobium sp. BYY-5]|uniref:glycoside hydrolase family 2 protein n=1 Tax=Sphingobium sp. BYY-5 TaxID=2926400 RepID=UPI001FA6EF7A|nr:glycoside hydrolase family 2 TIM barrel-domain containing protein [Sphingobium sp. BYY-5]MCI4589496.1 glycoside hydrolase family 2 protein [Sphingobium sp. BYY-5]